MATYSVSLVSTEADPVLGMNTVLFIMCVYVLVREGKVAFGNKPFLITAVIIYMLCTAQVINELSQAITAFISYKDNPGGPAAFYHQLRLWRSVIRQVLFCTNNAVTDALLVYRLYVMRNFHVKVVIGPILLLAVATACGYRAAWGLSDSKQGDAYAPDIYMWELVSFAFSLVLNIIVTSLIAERLWRFGKRTAATLGQRHSRSYNHAMAMIVESGAIYSICVIIMVITYAAKTNGMVSINDPATVASIESSVIKQIISYMALAQITGMNPLLIIVRVGLGMNPHDATYQTTTRNIGILTSNSGQGRGQHSDALSVHVRRVTQTKADEGLEDAAELDVISHLPKHATRESSIGV
ncbi:hypothetical protein Moror_3319 [Moniliophthora roreri MCA 2997]|uniref:Uncharacterized protein n=1 Tax=Moniliophthora roreri (strain MCA 2997) TaxID=1381753 RepID=V2Y5Q5_MONRO|nr:hypothetical protein Moror_3319 [Moniliophthora roreri MCA 2997]